jgi:tetratricopeptide (TPR) repeat protein
MSSRRLICIVLALLTLVTFAQVRHFEFTNYDDPDYVSENPHVRRGISGDGIRWAFIESRVLFWIPVTWLSHEADCTLFGVEAGAHHGVNLLLHAANVLLLFLMLHRLTGAMWRSALVAACFAVHPLNVESVAWIAERKGLLSTFFLMLTLHAWLSWAARPHPARYGLALVLFALGLLAKPMLVTLPLLLLLLDRWPLARMNIKPWRFLLLEKIPFFALALASGLATVFFASHPDVWISAEQIPPAKRIANAPIFICFYLWKLVAPVNLAAFYPFAQNNNVWPGVVAGLGIAVVTVIAWRRRGMAPWFFTGWMWYVVALLPVLRIVQVGAHGVADRYAYVPLIGIFVVAAWGGTAMIERFRLSTRVAAVLAGAVIISLAALSWFQAGVWQNSIALFSHALEVTPNNAVAHLNLGAALEQAGRPGDALPHYLEALRIDPGRAQAHHNLANLLDLEGRFTEAMPHFVEAIRLRPREMLPHCSLGLALAGQKRHPEALEEYRTAMQLAPADPLPYYLTGVTQLRTGQLAAGAASFREALQRNPQHVKSLDRLARVLAAAPDDALRAGVEALRLTRQAMTLTGGRQPAVMDTLAMALAECGRFEEASKTLQSAIDILTQAGAKDEARQLEPKLRQYENRQPWRESFTAD